MKKDVKGIDKLIIRQYLADKLMGNNIDDGWDPFTNRNDFKQIFEKIFYLGYPHQDWVVDKIVSRVCWYREDRAIDELGYCNNLKYDGVLRLLSASQEEIVRSVYEALTFIDEDPLDLDRGPDFNLGRRKEDFKRYKELKQVLDDSRRAILNAEEELQKINNRQGFE